MKTRFVMAGLIVVVGMIAVGMWLSRRPAERNVPSEAATAEAAAPVVAPPGMAEPARESVAAPTTADRWGATMKELARLQTLPANDPGREAKLSLLLARLLAADPAAVARWFATLPAGEARDELLRLLARTWSASDFPGAIAWAATLADEGERRLAFEHACFEAGRANPAEALEAWLAFDGDPTRAAYGDLIQSWAARDLPGALAWAEARPESAGRDEALARVAYVMARDDPAAAARLISTQMATGPAQFEAAVSLVHAWASRDVAAATAWLNQRPDVPFNARARAEIAGALSEHPDS